MDIEAVLKEFLTFMNVGFEKIERIENSQSKHVRFLIHTKDSSVLIGPQGEHLGALNYIIRRVISKKTSPTGTPVKFVVDVNGYQDKALEHLKAKVKIMSDRARSFKVDVELDPMSSYERMQVHSFLDGQKDIKTESRGEGAQRRVVIKYVA
ncbi:MAG: R3H domain-containing nucleic acid-binding protein [Patescibacteria group bacterium]